MHHMHFPKTYLSLHDVTGLRASTVPSSDRPLILTVDSPHGAMQISFYLQPLLTEDQIEALAKAIGAAMTKAEPAAVCPVEKLAYKSQEEYWAALKRDLDRGWNTGGELGKLQAGAPSPVDGKR
jgi:hypothetical protein